MSNSVTNIAYPQSSSTPVKHITSDVIQNIPTRIVRSHAKMDSESYSMNKFGIRLSSVLRILYGPATPVWYEGTDDDLYQALRSIDDFQDTTSVGNLKFVADKVCYTCGISINDLIKSMITYMSKYEQKDYLDKYPFATRDRCMMYVIDLFDLGNPGSSIGDCDTLNDYKITAAKVVIALTELYESKISYCTISSACDVNGATQTAVHPSF